MKKIFKYWLHDLVWVLACGLLYFVFQAIFSSRSVAEMVANVTASIIALSVTSLLMRLTDKWLDGDFESSK